MQQTLKEPTRLITSDKSTGNNYLHEEIINISLDDFLQGNYPHGACASHGSVSFIGNASLIPLYGIGDSTSAPTCDYVDGMFLRTGEPITKDSVFVRGDREVLHALQYAGIINCFGESSLSFIDSMAMTRISVEDLTYYFSLSPHGILSLYLFSSSSVTMIISHHTSKENLHSNNYKKAVTWEFPAIGSPHV